MHPELYVPSFRVVAAARAAVTALAAAGQDAGRLAAAAQAFQAEPIPSHLRWVVAAAREAAEAAEEAVREWRFRRDPGQAALARAAADAARAVADAAL